MTRISATSFLLLLLSITFSLTACVSSRPVETKHAGGEQSLLFFSVNEATPLSGGTGVYVDNLYMGKAIEISRSKEGLVVLPGTHIVEIRDGNDVLKSQKVFVSDGTSKTITIP